MADGDKHGTWFSPPALLFAVCRLAPSFCAWLLNSALDTCALAPSTGACAREGADVTDLDLLKVPISTGDRTGECPGERSDVRTELPARALGIERFFSELTLFIVHVDMECGEL